MSKEYSTANCGDKVDHSTSNNQRTVPTHWMPEEICTLITLVELDPAIYNPHHKYFYSQAYGDCFWRSVDVKLCKRPGECLAKWIYLRLKFKREYAAYLKDGIRSSWSYFDRMSFLQPFLKQKSHLKSSTENRPKDPALTGGNTYSNFCSSDGMNGEDEGAAHRRNDVILGRKRLLDPATFDEPSIKNSNSDFKNHNDNDLGQNVTESDQTGYLLESLMTPRLRNADDNRLRDAKLTQTRPEHRSLDSVSPTNCYGVADPSSARPGANMGKNFSQQRTTSLNFNSPSGRPMRDYPTHCRQASQLGYNYPTPNQDRLTASNSLAGQTNDLQEAASSLSTTAIPSAVPIDKFGSIEAVNVDKVKKHSIDFKTGLEVSKDEVTSRSTKSLTPICNYKTDPDAMFLLSLLPDLRKLDSRRRCKVKMEFQRILLSCIYPN